MHASHIDTITINSYRFDISIVQNKGNSLYVNVITTKMSYCSQITVKHNILAIQLDAYYDIIEH